MSLYSCSFNDLSYVIELVYLSSSRHILVVFGGKDGIEAALEADEKLKANKIEQVFNFNCELSQVKSQSSLFGSRTIRLEVRLEYCELESRLKKSVMTNFA